MARYILQSDRGLVVYEGCYPTRKDGGQANTQVEEISVRTVCLDGECIIPIIMYILCNNFSAVVVVLMLPLETYMRHENTKSRAQRIRNLPTHHRRQRYDILVFDFQAHALDVAIAT